MTPFIFWMERNDKLSLNINLCELQHLKQVVECVKVTVYQQCCNDLHNTNQSPHTYFGDNIIIVSYYNGVLYIECVYNKF